MLKVQDQNDIMSGIISSASSELLSSQNTTIGNKSNESFSSCKTKMPKAMLNGGVRGDSFLPGRPRAPFSINSSSSTCN